MLSILIMHAILYMLIAPAVHAYSKSKPHSHQGSLIPYDGKHIPYNITLEQLNRLNSGLPVLINERVGKSGRGIVIQDVHASPATCMRKISDLANYHTMVPNVKSIEIYSNETFANGTVQIGALFRVGVSFVTFGYYLLLTYEPEYNTYTWTLDYRYASDFDDNTGHWQVMPHPHKEGYTRVLYSTEVKLFAWIPEFVVTFLTKTALLESTSWVKKESEKAELAGPDPAALNIPDLSSCFTEDGDGGRYSTACSEGKPHSALDNLIADIEDVVLVADEDAEISIGEGGEL
jgi:carbon monoxide dehydrogenase subunit G